MLALTVPCCDNCLKIKEEQHGRRHFTPEEEAVWKTILQLRRRLGPEQDIAFQESDDEEPAPRGIRRRGARRAAHLAACRNVLTQWRQNKWLDDFKHCAFGPAAILDDTQLTVLASRAHINNIEDIKAEIPRWIWADEYGEEVLAALRQVDDDRTAEAKRTRQEAHGAVPIQHPWPIPEDQERPRDHFWSHPMQAWLPIPVQYELKYF